MKQDYGHILNFWFGDLTDQTPLNNRNPIVRRWFNPTPEFDRDIKLRFEPLLSEAAHHKDGDNKSYFALVILFDQFPRNMYREDARCYQYDHRALTLTQQVLSNRADKELHLFERLFLYMPLMHAENEATQELSVQYFEELFNEAGRVCPQNQSYYKSNLQYAKNYRGIIKQFGRFPQRNAILNRSSTAEERVFLQQ
jgi:uncharacterized protein (DUF924 family)